MGTKGIAGIGSGGEENKSLNQKLLASSETKSNAPGNGTAGDDLCDEEDPSNMSSLNNNRWYSSGRKRHFRRCNNEIKKSYICPYGSCGKNYGSEGSLNLHMKLKHKAGSKTEREKYAREIVIAIRAGNDITEE